MTVKIAEVALGCHSCVFNAEGQLVHIASFPMIVARKWHPNTYHTREALIQIQAKKHTLIDEAVCVKVLPLCIVVNHAYAT